MAETVSELEMIVLQQQNVILQNQQRIAELNKAIVEQQKLIDRFLELIQEVSTKRTTESESKIIKRLDELEERLTINLLD